MQPKIDYNFVERHNSELYSIQLLSGQWIGVIYTYGTVSITENSNRDGATLSFDYKIEDTSGLSEAELQASVGFKNHIGDILASILSEDSGRIGKLEHGKKLTNNNHTKLNS